MSGDVTIYVKINGKEDGVTGKKLTLILTRLRRYHVRAFT